MFAEEQALDVGSLDYAEIPLVVEAGGKALFRVIDSLDYKKTSRDESKKRGPPDDPMSDEDLRKKRKVGAEDEDVSDTPSVPSFADPPSVPSLAKPRPVRQPTRAPQADPLNAMAGPSSVPSIADNDKGRDLPPSDVGGGYVAPADTNNGRASKSRMDELRERLMGSRKDLTVEDEMLGNELAGYKLNGAALLARMSNLEVDKMIERVDFIESRRKEITQLLSTM